MQTRDFYYEDLGIKRFESLDEVKRAYRALALKHHPDRGGKTEDFQLIQRAYEVLSDPVKKAKYDDYLRQKAKPSQPRGASERPTWQPYPSHFQSDDSRRERKSPPRPPQASNFRSNDDFDKLMEQNCLKLWGWTKIGGKYLGFWVTPYLAMILNFIQHTRSYSNPQLAEQVREAILSTVQNKTQTFLDSEYYYNFGTRKDYLTFSETISSPFCDEILKIAPNFFNANRKIAYLLSPCHYPMIRTNLVNLTDQLGHYHYGYPGATHYQFDPDQAFIPAAGCIGIALAAAGKTTYDIYRERGEFWGSDLTLREKTRRAFVLLALLIPLVIALDAILNGAFGFTPSLAGVIPRACAETCESLFSVRHVINGTTEILFKHAPLPVQSEKPVFSVAKSVGVSVATSACTFVGSRWLALRNRGAQGNADHKANANARPDFKA